LPRLALIAGLGVALGVIALAYRGPGRHIVRGHVGDIGATMLVYALISAPGRGPAWARALVTAAIALAIELRQVVAAAPDDLVGTMVLGSTFDTWDLGAYAVGIVAAWTLDRAGAPR
jgi:hypothetical protein